MGAYCFRSSLCWLRSIDTAVLSARVYLLDSGARTRQYIAR